MSAKIARAESALITENHTTTSLIIAECFGKDHAKVLRAIDALHVPTEYHKTNFGLKFRTVNIGSGAARESKYYELTRDGFSLLVMGFTGARAMEWKIKFLDAFAAMESALTGKAGAAARIDIDRAASREPGRTPDRLASSLDLTHGAPDGAADVDPPPAPGILRARAERQAAIRRHASALMALARAECPIGHNALAVTLVSDWGPDPRLNVDLALSAQSHRTDWRASRHTTMGGAFGSFDTCRWVPGLKHEGGDDA